MSGSHNSSTNGSELNRPDNSGRSFPTSFPAQSGALSPAFHQTGYIQGLHNIHGNFNDANTLVTFGFSNVADIPITSGVQQPRENLFSGQLASNSIPSPSQISHGISQGHSWVTNRGVINTSSQRSISSTAGLSMPGLDSRLNVTNNSGPGNLNVQESNRLMGEVHQQDSPAVSSMLGNINHGAGTLSQNHDQSVSNRPSSVRGPEGKGSLGKQGLSVSPTVQQQNPGFSFQTEDFPALPGIRASSSTNQTTRMPSRRPFTSIRTGPQITGTVGNMVGGGSIGRSISSSAGLPTPRLDSRLNLTNNSGAGNLNVQGSNRLMGGVLQQGPLSQNDVQSANNRSSVGLSNDVNGNDGAPSNINDFPQLTSRPSSAGGQGSPRTQGLSVIPTVQQQNPEFSIQTEDFPTLPASRAVSSMLGDSYHGAGPLSQNHVQSVNNPPSSAVGPQAQGSVGKQGVSVSPPVQQKKPEFCLRTEDFPAFPGFKVSSPTNQANIMPIRSLHTSVPAGVRDNEVSMQPRQHTAQVGRSAEFYLGGSFSSHRPQQHQQLLPPESSSGFPFPSRNNQAMRSSDFFPSSHASYHPQTSGAPVFGSRPLNPPNMQQNPSLFHPQQISSATQSYRDPGMSSMPPVQSGAGSYGMLDLKYMLQKKDPNQFTLALGIDLLGLGLNMNSTEKLHKTFSSPFSDNPTTALPDFTIPQSYNAAKPPELTQRNFSKMHLGTLFYVFYSMPRDTAQLYAANELHIRGWFFHRKQQLWLLRVPNMVEKKNTYERGSYTIFDPDTWEMVQRANFVVHYKDLERRPALPPPPPPPPPRPRRPQQ